MSADQVAEIAPLVREVLAAAADRASSTDLCATFEVVGNASAWAQVTSNSLNISYPHLDAPLGRLKGIVDQLPDAHLVAFEPGKYATIAFGLAAPMVIARAVDGALALLFALDDYSLDAQLERL